MDEKLVVILNNKSKVSKGKMCRVCLTLGMNHKGTVPFKAFILRGDDVFYEIFKNNEYRIIASHIDAGMTQCDPHTMLGFSLFCDENEFKELKLY